jgi:hypothetical protein
MLAKLKGLIGGIVAAAHNAWLQIPAAVREALSLALAVFIAAAIAQVRNFGWYLPADWPGLQTELLAFWAYALPPLMVLAALLIRTKIAPPIVEWFLVTFGYYLLPPARGQRAGIQLQPGAWYRGA